MALCGAKTRAGHPCRSHAMPNGRCRKHGGKSTGAPTGNQNARTHGIYSSAIQPDEVELWDQIVVDDIDDAIKIAHLQLRRAMIAQAKAEQGDGLDLDLDQVTTNQLAADEGEDDEGKSSKSSTVQRRRRPYEDIITRQLGRIGDLVSKRAQIMSSAPPSDPGAGAGEEYVLRPDEDVPSDPVL